MVEQLYIVANVRREYGKHAVSVHVEVSASDHDSQGGRGGTDRGRGRLGAILDPNCPVLSEHERECALVPAAQAVVIIEALQRLAVLQARALAGLLKLAPVFVVAEAGTHVVAAVAAEPAQFQEAPR